MELRFFDKELAAMVPGLVTDFDGDEEAELYGGRPFRAADMGV